MPDSFSPSTSNPAPVAPEGSSSAKEAVKRFSVKSLTQWFTAGEYALVLVMTLSVAALFRWQLGGPNFVYAASGAAQLLAALGGVIACMIALRRLSVARVNGIAIESRDLWPWGVIATSLLCFATAHALSMSEWLPSEMLLSRDVVQGESWRQRLAGVDASVLWIVQYPLLWLGLLILAWPDNVVRARTQKSNKTPSSAEAGMVVQTHLMRVVADRLIIVLAVLVVFWKTLLEQPFFSSYEMMPLAQKSLAFCFPIGIAGHLFCALMLLTAPRRRLHSRTLALLLVALALLATTDTVYAFVVVQTFYALGAVLDAGWIGAWLLFGVAALDAADQILKHRQLVPSIAPERASLSKMHLFAARLDSRSMRRNAIDWLPYVVALVACCVLLVSENSRASDLSHVLPVVGLMMAVLVRQMLSLLDNRTLANRLTTLNRDLECKVDDRTRHLSTLHSVASTLNASLDERAILRAILEGLMPAIHATHGGIWLRPLVPAAPYGRRIHTRNQGNKITVEKAPPDTDCEGWMSECCSALQSDKTLREALRRTAVSQSLSGLTSRSADTTPANLPATEDIIAVSIRWQGNLLGVIGLTKENGEFSSAERALVNSVAVEAGTALQNARLYQEASRRADRDSVTELLNHRAVQQELHAVLLQARQHTTSFAVVMMDLNNFKFFNDTYGHLTGDDVLRAVAQTLTVACRDSDVVGRYGGDEFIAILPATDAEGAREICARIASELDRHHFEAATDSHIPIAMNFGMAIYPYDGETPLELTNRADANLYQNKRNGTSLLPLTLGAKLSSTILAAQREDGGGRSGQAFGVLDALVTAIDNKDHYTRHHSEEVAQLALMMAAELGYSNTMQSVVRMSAILHDVGKIAVPDSVLRHPGRLGDAETAIMRQHPVFGALIVRDIAHQDAVVSGVRHHHERYDGTGYPDGLRGDKIPWMGRLLAVADVYSALTTDRPYRKALSPEAALYEIESGAGTQFDPNFASTFLRVMRRELHRVSHHHPHPNTPRVPTRPTLRMAPSPTAKSDGQSTAKPDQGDTSTHDFPERAASM